MSPPRFTVLRFQDQPVVPWRNGGGTTREVARFPAGSSAQPFAWRVSVARVATDGPFSPFPGVDRTLWLVQGRGMRLDVDGRPATLSRRFARLDFPGEAAVMAHLLEGPTEDLNVMVDRTRFRATSCIAQLGAGTTLANGVAACGHAVALVLRGRVRARAGAEEATLGESDGLQVEGERADTPWSLVAANDALVAWARFVPAATARSSPAGPTG